MAISTVLLDADGVLQFADPLYAHVEREYGWSRQRLRDLFRRVEEHDGYQGAETGQVDPVPVIGAVLAEWDWTHSTDTFLRQWLRFGTVPDPDAVALVAKLRAGGVTCALGTNQPELRSRYMHEELGYQDLFDQCFYSSRLGAAKPDPAFFEAVLAALGEEPHRVLFLDDHEPNVEAARGCGLHAHLYRRPAALRDTLAAYALPL